VCNYFRFDDLLKSEFTSHVQASQLLFLSRTLLETVKVKMKYPEVLLPIPMETNRRVTRSSAAFSNQDLENMEIKKLAVSRTAPPTPSTSNQNDSDSPPVARAHTKNGVKKPAPKKPKLGPKTKKRPPGKFRIAYTNRKAIKLLSESGNNELSMDSMSFLTDEEKLFLSSWGLPSQVLAVSIRFRASLFIGPPCE